MKLEYQVLAPVNLSSLILISEVSTISFNSNNCIYKIFLKFCSEDFAETESSVFEQFKIGFLNKF